MNRRALISVSMSVLVLLCFSMGAAYRTAAEEARPIPAEQIRPVTPPVVSGAKDYCFLDYTDWNAMWFYGQWKYGDKVAIYFDPEECGNPQNYPFQLTDVHFYLHDHAGLGACSLRFSVEVVCPDICDGPGIEIWKSSTYYITTFYPDLAEVYFDDTICLDKPFFFNVEFLQGPQGQVPSLLWDDQMVDDCYQWLWFGQPAWLEWHDYFGPGTPGWVCLGISGYCGEAQTDCGWWYWKPDTLPQAPSGMPDFDQNQRDWVAYCGPTAVANCLWWFDAIPTVGMDPADFIELLAGYFGTTSSGTYVDSIQAGLERYFDDYGFALTETTYWMPDFHEMEDSLKKCQDIILLLGFWWYAEGTEQEFIRGDINADGAVDLQDIVLCQGGPPFACMDAADVNDDGVFNTLDCDYLYNYYFGTGPPPPPPFPDCGVDPTPDGLDCQSFPPCPGGSPGEWYREGGHFVTMAGVNSEKKEIAISDPDRDQVVRYPWWPGRVRLADHPPWGGYPPDLHNDPNYVSHDIYISLLFPEFPSPGSEVWDLADYCYGQTFPLMNVPHRFEALSREAPKHYEYFHTEVEAAIMICPTDVPNNPPEIGQPDFLEGYVDDIVSYEITGSDPDGDVILDDASIDIQPGCGSGYSITRTSGHGTSSGTWDVVWYTDGCAACDTHMVIHDLTDEHGLVGYCTTYVHLSERDDSLWYWKPDTTWAPSGMPDFDQNQPGWMAYCGPTAVANCLWWYDAVPVGWTPPQLIDTLARYFHTSPVWGTYVDTMQMGLEQYFQDYGFAFQESTFHMPDFYEMEDSLKRCQDIILLLGFWFYDISSEQWYREGGHFVTMAGVCSESLRIAISDPDADWAVAGWPGRVRPLTHPPAGSYPPTLHNDPTYVSHDMFNSILDSPFPSPGNPFWELDYPWWMKRGEFAGFNVPHEFRNVTRRAPPGDKQIFATEVEYAVMICPTAEEPRECDDNDPKECDTLWVECGKMLVPPGGGLVTVDMTIAFDESLKVFQVPLSYEGSPICCDSMPEDENTPAKVFAGSIVPGTWITVVNIDHVAKEVVVAGVAMMPPGDCLLPQKGHLATLTLWGDSCCTIQLDTTDWTGNHVGFVDCHGPSSTLFYPVVRTDTCHIDRNYPPVIGQPDFLEGYVDDVVQYDITGTDPDGDAIEDDASIDIQPGCGDYSITRTSGHGTSSGTWQVTWNTTGCTPCDTHMVIHDLTDTLGFTAYCTTLVHLSQEFDTTWYWKDPYEDYSPNGMPDIDQRQDGWLKTDTDQWSFCGPAAVANCFKWFDSKYNDVAPGAPGDGIDQFPLVRDYLDDLGPLVGYDDHDPWNIDHVGTPWGPAIGPPPATAQPFVPGPQVPGGGLPPWGELVERLAWFFDTDGIQTGYCEHTGTNVMEMQAGIQEWLESERFADAVPQFIRGDIDGNGNVNMTDAVACAAGGPFACDDAADVNDDGVLDMADCTYLTNYLAAGGPAPPMPFPDCGKDPSADALGCNDCPACPWSNTLADSLCEVTTPMPSFAYVESLVHKCEDVILLLGFWFDEDPQQFIRGDVNADGFLSIADIAALVIGPPFMCDDAADVNDDGALNSLDSAYLWDWIMTAVTPPPPPFPNCGPDPTYDNLRCADFPPCPGAGGVWRRIGGHYVTVAGVNSERFKIAFSDPFVDNAEFGAPGRVGNGIIIPHSFPHAPTVHNDEGNVSHDIYDAEIPSVSPGGEWWLPGYAVNGDPGYWVWNFHDQNVPEEFEPMTAQWNGTSPIHTEVEYCVHISPWDYRGDANNDGIVDVGDVVYLIAFLYRGGPVPVPMSVGDVNCDGIVDVGDVVFLINYLYRNGPVPRCCDP